MAKKRPPPLNIGYNEHGIVANRYVLYRNFHEVGGKIYLIEISRSSKKVFIILFPNFEEPHVNVALTFPVKLGYKLMSDNENSFKKFVNQFYIKFGTLQIGGYNGPRRPYVEPSTEQLEAIAERHKFISQRHRNKITDHSTGHTNETSIGEQIIMDEGTQPSLDQTDYSQTQKAVDSKMSTIQTEKQAQNLSTTEVNHSSHQVGSYNPPIFTENQQIISPVETEN